MSGHVTPEKAIAFQKIGIVLLICCIVQFSSAWLYPATSFSGVNTAIQEKLLGVPFQYGLWLAVLLAFFYDVANYKIDFYLTVFRPFVLIYVVGIVSALFGVMPFDSIRLLVLYLVMFIASVLTCSILSVSSSRNVLYKTFSVILFVSIVFSIAVPQIGAQSYSGVVAWRGLFTNKNTFGWFSAIGLIVAVLFFDKSRTWRSVFFVLVPVAALLFSQSKGSLVASLASILFIPVLVFLQKRVSLWLAVLTFSVFFFLVSVLVYFFFTDVLLLLGRDVTLTGRTVIWGMYFKSMLNTPFLGGGPGSYTSLSELTLPLAFRLQDMGAILTPHNIYLAAFGEVGLFGLMSFAGVLIYFSFFQYFNFPNIYSLACAAVSILLLIGGFSETHEVFSAGLSMFVMILFRSMALKQYALQSDKVNING